jgi:toxin HigB-1
MRIRGFRHKGLRLLFEEDIARGLPAETVDKLRKMLAFLQDVSTPAEVRDVPA